jgi:hypothetical protein
MSNHREPPPRPREPAPHEPGRPDRTPHEREPFDPEHPDIHLDEHLGEGWGVDPLATNPFRPGEHPVLVRTLTERWTNVLAAPNLADPNVRILKQAAARIQLPFDRLKPADPVTQATWEHYKESASSFRACLPDFCRDGVTYLHDKVQKIEDATGRDAATAALGEVFKTQGDFFDKLRDWDAKRRVEQFDWGALADLQRQLTDQLMVYLSGLKALETADANLHAVAASGQVFLSALGFELGRQGEELTSGGNINYGSAPVAVADVLAKNTSQNKEVNDLINGANLEPKLGLTNEYAPLPVQNKFKSEVAEPLQAKLEAWRQAAGWAGKTQGWSGAPDYDGVISATKDLLDENSAQRARLDGGDFRIAAYRRDQLRDTLSLVNDVMVYRLKEIREGADLEHQEDLDQLLEEAKTRRQKQKTQTERLATSDAVDEGLSKFWSKAKERIFAAIEENVVDGKKLKNTLDNAFNAGLSGMLDDWSREIKKAPKHDTKALHDAAWKIRLTTRRYRDAIESASNKPDYIRRSVELLTSLDVLQVAVSNRINQALVDGYNLF